ncbi:hypothetical protein GUITHDRAFT_114445 [Guillardia theta CCMP2712]|uniref:Uncharacterized protein n=1 Tax=Guillardia theta (strain CCMP2712) TaxID=905079 RepID=L1ITQ1_GUITC|nr:hypothetical protein GUITHDRAFT_114445 [Guillardia theta CCMP2712]EKX39482.1 hypothetical protein GUITHDRAFT_114445 [Guillardia theta CCMP2712]|eukprot:XP_005826462.1 hypothetical protein GUITHDRAFT_114445 [Guillardia theta CCMP2712]
MVYLKLFRHLEDFVDFSESVKAGEEEEEEGEEEESISLRVVLVGRQGAVSCRKGVYCGQALTSFIVKTSKFNKVVRSFSASLPAQLPASQSLRLYVPCFDMPERGAQHVHGPLELRHVIKVNAIDIAASSSFFDACLVDGDVLLHLLDAGDAPYEYLALARGGGEDGWEDFVTPAHNVSLNVPGTMDFSIDLEVSSCDLVDDLRLKAVSHPRWLLQLGLVSRVRGAEEELRGGRRDGEDRPWGPMYIEGFPVSEHQPVFRTGLMGGGRRRGAAVFVDTLNDSVLRGFSLPAYVTPLLPRGFDDRLASTSEFCVRTTELRARAADRHPSLELLRRDVPPDGLTFEEWKDVEMEAARERSLLAPACLTALNPFLEGDSVRQMEFCPWEPGVVLLGSCEGRLALCHDMHRSSHILREKRAKEEEEEEEEEHRQEKQQEQEHGSSLTWSRFNPRSAPAPTPNKGPLSAWW